jgi:hypothetical protein
VRYLLDLLHTPRPIIKRLVDSVFMNWNFKRMLDSETSRAILPGVETVSSLVTVTKFQRENNHPPALPTLYEALPVNNELELSLGSGVFLLRHHDNVRKSPNSFYEQEVRQFSSGSVRPCFHRITTSNCNLRECDHKLGNRLAG